MTFGQFIRQKRESLNISQKPLMDALDRSRGGISRLESGGLQWKLDDVIAVAPVFRMSASELVEEYIKSI